MFQAVLAKRFKRSLQVKKIMMIGYGAMAKTVASFLPESIQIAWIIVPEYLVAKTQEELGGEVQVVASVDEVIGTPDLVIEMAGPIGLRMHGPAILEKGWNIGVISMGTFTDDAFTEELRAIGQRTGAKVFLLSGAIAGIDGISAAKVMGLDRVIYEGRKNPRSWAGSKAEELCDLNHLNEATVFFKGTAREAASLFPANANVAATLALAGIGLDETEVELVADPAISKNQHTVHASGKFGELSMKMAGLPLENNPKTSTLAALSVARLCLNQDAVLVI